MLPPAGAFSGELFLVISLFPRPTLSALASGLASIGLNATNGLAPLAGNIARKDRWAA